MIPLGEFRWRSFLLRLVIVILSCRSYAAWCASKNAALEFSSTNVGEILPKVVMDHTDEQLLHHGNLQPAKDKDPFFWTDCLGQKANSAMMERQSRLFPDTQSPFSLLSWNILSQKLYDVNMVHKYANNIQVYKFSWEQRLEWILDTLIQADADVVCLQEVEYSQYFVDLLPALQKHGYQGVVQGEPAVKEIKRRKGKGSRAHVVATFWKSRRFQPINVTSDEMSPHMARGRTLTSILQDKKSGPILAVVNCHLEGHPNQYAARLRQLQHAMEDLIKRCPLTLNGLTIAGDMNCELQSSACSTYLRIGRVGRKGGLGGVHGTSSLVVPPSLLLSEEAAACLDPILEWGKPIPNEVLESVPPHPFRRNSLMSSYPPSLGQSDPSSHFTYCANPNRPVAGLDQIWFSGFSLTRVALRIPFSLPQERRQVLSTGLPAPSYPSDHIPIGTVLGWKNLENVHSVDAGFRELIVTKDNFPTTPKPKSPIMAYAELDMLLVTCPFDSEKQRLELEAIVNDVPDLPPDNRKPSPEQLRKLSLMRERKKLLLKCASEPVRKTLQRILKLKKIVTSYEDEMCPL